MWDFFDKRTVRSRQARTCMECPTPIPAGTPHVYCAGKVEGEFTAYRLCETCDLITTEASIAYYDDGEGWPSDVRQNLREEYGIEDAEAWAREHQAKRLDRGAQRKAAT